MQRRLGKLLQMAEPVFVQGLEPVAFDESEAIGVVGCPACLRFAARPSKAAAWMGFCAWAAQNSGFDAVVLILKPHDVVFAEIAPRLHFDDFQGDDARVFQPVMNP